MAGFLLKVAAGVALGLIYTYYYTDRLTADTFKYFDDSAILFHSVFDNPYDFIRMVTGIGADHPTLQPYYDRMTNWYETFSPFNDNRTMIRLNALLRFFSLGYYYVHVVFVCFFSFTGILAIVQVFRREFPGRIHGIYLVFVLLPSVLLWGSGLLKDSLIFFAAGFLMYYTDKFIHERNIKYLGGVIVFLFLLMITKFYVFVLFLPLLACWWFAAWRHKSPWLVFSAGIVMFFILAMGTRFIFPGFDVLQVLASKQQAFFRLASESNAGSAIPIMTLEPTFLGIFKAIPSGFATAFFRPFITDTGPLLNTLSALENTFILIWCLYSIFKVRNANLSGKILPVFCIFYTLMLYTLIGMITPVLGAIVRYKAQALPFMVSLLLILTYPTIRKVVFRFGQKNLTL